MGAALQPVGDWGTQTLRVLALMDNQVRAQRRRKLVDDLLNLGRQGTYWSIWQAYRQTYPDGSLDCDEAATAKLAATPTVLRPLAPRLRECLVNWGYATCDVAIRANLPTLARGSLARRFPYVSAGVG
jgi:NTE family protein